MPCRVLVAETKRLRTFQCPPAEEAVEVAKIYGLLKVQTPGEFLRGGLHGNELFAGRGNLEGKCNDLATNLVELNPYVKKSALDSALLMMDQENKGMLSKGVFACRILGQEGSLCLEGAPHEKT